MKSGIQIRNEKKESGLVVHLEGKLDAVSSPQLEEALASDIAAGEKNVILDFTGIDYLSSAGLRVLLSNTKKLHNTGGSLGIYGMLDDVYDIVKMAGFEKVLNLYSSEKEALKDH